MEDPEHSLKATLVPQKDFWEKRNPLQRMKSGRFNLTLMRPLLFSLIQTRGLHREQTKALRVISPAGGLWAGAMTEARNAVRTDLYKPNFNWRTTVLFEGPQESVLI